jgi:uncharacterized RDD family membrane protein YckC
MSTSTTTAAPGTPRRAGSRPARVLLWSGGVITAAAAIALLVILALYFVQQDPPTGFYFTALWGFPLGFLLLIAYLLFSMNRRRRGTGIG